MHNLSDQVSIYLDSIKYKAIIGLKNILRAFLLYVYEAILLVHVCSYSTVELVLRWTDTIGEITFVLYKEVSFIQGFSFFNLSHNS